MKNPNSEIVVGLDIGTTKICVFVAKMNESRKLEVIGFGKAESHGVLRGEVFNIDKTCDAIKLAVTQAQEQSGYQIKSVFVGIAGKHIQSSQSRTVMTRKDRELEITDTEVNSMIQDMYRMATNPGEKIIHVLPQEFTVDAEQGIKDPVGHCGSRLEGNFHVITGQVMAARNIERAVYKAGLSVSGLILEPLASADSVLSDEEKEAGVALVDIGGGTTDIAIFHEGIIRHTAVIPFGGNIITEDIKAGLKVMRNQAEQLKVKFGSAVAVETISNEIITIPGLRGRDAKEVSVRNLAHIIESRVQEIFEQVYFEVKASGYANGLICGIVITGGGSQLKHLRQAVEFTTGLDCRIGYPTEHIEKNTKGELRYPMYATGLGLVLKGIEVNRINKTDVKEAVQMHAHQAASDAIENNMMSSEEEEIIKPTKSKPSWKSKIGLGPILDWFKSDADDFNS